MSEKSDTPSQETSTQWAEIIGQLVDKLVGKNIAMTYNFDNLTIDMPKALGPGGQHLGSVKWTINGKVIIATEAYKKNKMLWSDPEKMLCRDKGLSENTVTVWFLRKGKVPIIKDAKPTLSKQITGSDDMQIKSVKQTSNPKSDLKTD